MLNFKTLFDDTLRQITDSEQEWKNFLKFSGQLFKYNFFDTVQIYGQRPDATMVADMNTWNGKVGRWVNRGSRAIKVYDNDSRSTRYLFDVSDTHGLASQRIRGYTLKSEAARSFVMNYLGADDKRNFEEFVEDICIELTYKQDFQDEEIGGFICDSVVYSVLGRLEYDTEKEIQFQNVLQQLNYEQAAWCAEVVNEISGQVLRLLEKPARIYEKITEQKEKENNENKIYRGNRDGRDHGDTGGSRGSEEAGKEAGSGENTADGSSGGVRGGTGRNALSENSTGRKSGTGEDTGGDIRKRGGEVPDRELSGESTAAQNSGDLVQHVIQDRQSGTGNDGNSTDTAETEESGTADGQLHGAGELQQLDQGDSPGDSIERGSKNSGINAGNTIVHIKNDKTDNESSKNGGSYFLPEKQLSKQLTLLDLIETEDIKQQSEAVRQDSDPAGGSIKDIPAENFDISESTVNKASGTNYSPEKINYKYDPLDGIGAGGQKTKYKANIEAIKLLKAIEGENRLAAADEQKVLSRYTGWGGSVQAFDQNAKGWENEIP
jgi:hypothetical protein